VWQADARALSNQIVSSQVVAQFEGDIAMSAAPLNRVKREGCPASGYPGGVNLH
jgi:hypothetical protein